EAGAMTAADPRSWMWAEACAMIERGEQLHRQFFRPGLARAPAANWEPPVDVFESERELTIVAALPGVEPQDIEISIDRDALLIAGVRRLPTVARGTAIHRVEIPHGRFERRIRLPGPQWGLGRSTLVNGCLLLSLTPQRGYRWARAMAEQPEQNPVDQGGGPPPLPPDGMILLPVRQTVLFPGIVLPLAIDRKSSIAAAQEAVRSQRMLGVILQTDPAVEEPTPEQLHRVGTAAQVLRYVTAPDGTHHVVAQGVRRFRVVEYLRGFPFLVARVEEIGIAEVMTPDIEARVGLVRTRAREAIELLPNVPVEVAATIENLDSASALADFIVGILDAKPSEKQDVLETVDIKERLDKVLALLAQRIEV